MCQFSEFYFLLQVLNSANEGICSNWWCSVPLSLIAAHDMHLYGNCLFEHNIWCVALQGSDAGERKYSHESSGQERKKKVLCQNFQTDTFILLLLHRAFR
jgi:hypothetical protein